MKWEEEEDVKDDNNNDDDDNDNDRTEKVTEKEWEIGQRENIDIKRDRAKERESMRVECRKIDK